jgi:hypothetical protein
MCEPLYMAAVLETDDGNLPHRIAAARAAMDARLHRLGKNGVGERLAIMSSLHGLKILREERILAKASLPSQAE